MSISLQPERLRVRTLEKIQIVKKNVYTTLNEDTLAEAHIPN
jgi:hypothetical protein